jgi:hypothetical protein
VSNFPTTAGRRMGFTITSTGNTVTLMLEGGIPGPVLFQLPSFVGNVASTSTGTLDQAAGSVALPAGVHKVTVRMGTLRSP